MSGFGETDWAALLGRHYGVSVRWVELVNVGVNATMRVDADIGEFYLRLYRTRGRTRRDIDAELTALLAFEPVADVHVAKPQMLRSGGAGYRFACVYEGRKRWAVLFAAAPGFAPTGGTGELRQLGAALGILHRQMTLGPPAPRRFDAVATISITAENIAKLGPDHHAAVTSVREIGTELCAALREGARLRWGFCHGDVWLGKNLHFDGRRTTFFDFDDCFNGPLAADLATLIAGLWYADLSDFRAQLRIALDAYTAVLRLAQHDLMSIPALIRLHEIRMLGFLARCRPFEANSWNDVLELFRQRCAEWGPDGIATAAIRDYVTMYCN